MDFLEYSDISSEIKGAMTPGRLKMTDTNIIFKNSKTGKVEQIAGSDIDLVNFQKFVSSWGIRLFMKNGSLHRFGGFKEGEQEKIAKFFKNNYKQDMLEKELSLKGWNWGTAKFNGSLFSFDVGNTTAFEVPLNYVSQCLPGKNEITMEFHPNDDAPVSLLEMRFHIPPSENADSDPVDAFHKNVMKNASVISVSGDAIAIFREIQCLTPRGRYDIKIFNAFFQLHGKTFDYKIAMSQVIRLFLLPHKDSRQMFFVVSLDPPIKQGQTRYHFLVLLFGQEEEISIELPFTEEQLKEKYEDKLTKELSGPTYEVLGKVMKVVINRKLTGPGNFVGHTGTPAIGCSFKAAAGYLYPLERGFIYVHKPPIHIRFEEIASVNFARSGGSTRSFDFEIELKSGTQHTFSSIEKEEYGKLFDFITAKKLNVKNRGKSDKASYKDDFGDSDNEIEPDAYLMRVKAEAEERDEDDGGDDSEESTDEDFNPNQEDSDVAEEYDSNHQDTDSDEDEEAGSGSDKDKPKKEKKEQKKKSEKKSKSAKTVSEAPRRQKGSKKDKDSNRPKRPSTAFMLWMNETRAQINADNPGLKVTEVAKKAGEMWKTVDKSVWEEKAKEEKEKYVKAMAEYEASGGAAADAARSESKSSSSKKSVSKKPASTPPKSSGGAFKSKEFINEDSSSDSDGEKASKKKGKSESGSDDEKPAVKKPKIEEPEKKSAKVDKSDDEKPAKKKTETKKPTKKKSDDEESEDEKKAKKKTDTKKPAKEDKSKKDDKKSDSKKKDSPKKSGGGDDDDEDDDDFEEEIETTPPTTDGSEEEDSD